MQTQEETCESKEGKEEEGELNGNGDDTKLTEDQVTEQTSQNVHIKNLELKDIFQL